jgi:hypothetical protein
MMDLELVRGDECIKCDSFVWRNITNLARAFGWKPKSRLLLKDKRHTANLEVSDDDAQSLALAVARCATLLIANRRPNRNQFASMVWFSGMNDVEGNSIFIHLEEPARIAMYCLRGGFRIRRCETEAAENREVSETTNEVSQRQERQSRRSSEGAR